MLLYKIKYKPYNTVFFFKKSHTNCYSCTGRVILTTFKIREPICPLPLPDFAKPFAETI